MSIRTKLTAMFLTIAIIPLLFVSIVSFNNYKKSLESLRLSQVQDLAAIKASNVEAYFAGLRASIETAQDFYNIKLNLPILLQYANDPDRREFITANNILNSQLERMQKVFMLAGIILVSPQGKVVYTSNHEYAAEYLSKPLPDPGQKAFLEGKKGVFLSDLFKNKIRANAVEMLVTAPIYDLKGSFIGVVALEVDMAPVYKLIQDVTGLGNTGEILLGKVIGDEVVYLNSLRHDEHAALTKRIPIGEIRGGPIQAAAEGKSGAGELVDYRGKRVISAWRYLPSLGWGLVAKIDAQEAFAEITNLRYLLVLILGIVFFLGALMAFSIANTIAEPIKNLSKGVGIIGGGNLDYKVGTKQKDEIGHLSRAFDDMTAEQKRVQERLLATSQYARSLLEASLDPFVTISADGKITDVNEATVKATGRSREDLINTDYSSCFTEPEKARASYQQVFSKGFVIDYPLTIRHKNGKLMDVLYNATIYKDTRGEVAGIFAAARDVTFLKQAEAELRRHRDSLEVLVKERTSDLEASNQELARSNEDLEQFAYVASHDLQEPLRVMSSFSQLLEKRYKDKIDQDANEFIDFIVDAARRMQGLITDLLAYSRVGRKDLVPTEVDTNEVVNKVIYSMSSTIKLSGGEVTHDKLPVLMVHETSIMQVFQNLISNALKFRRENAAKIHISAQENGDEWIFFVADNGLGIEPQYHQRIFQIFQRLHSREEYSGAGIGLSICKKIVSSYGGKMWVDSELGKGSTFYFTIPT